MGIVWERQIVMVAIGQLTQNIDMGGHGRSGETYLGEKPLGTSSSLTLRMYPAKRPPYLDKARGQRSKVIVTKNRFAPPQKQAQVDVLYESVNGVCVDANWPLLELATEEGVVTGGRGGVYKIGETKFKKASWHDYVPEALERLKADEVSTDR